MGMLVRGDDATRSQEYFAHGRAFAMGVAAGDSGKQIAGGEGGDLDEGHAQRVWLTSARSSNPVFRRPPFFRLAKVQFNSAIQNVTGKMRGWTYRKRGNKITLRAVPDPRNQKRKISQAEKATPVRTRIANSFGHSPKDNPEWRARYLAVARARGQQDLVDGRAFATGIVAGDTGEQSAGGQGGDLNEGHARRVWRISTGLQIPFAFGR